jgi:hypothetical protein
MQAVTRGSGVLSHGATIDLASRLLNLYSPIRPVLGMVHIQRCLFKLLHALRFYGGKGGRTPTGQPGYGEGERPRPQPGPGTGREVPGGWITN